MNTSVEQAAEKKYPNYIKLDDLPAGELFQYKETIALKSEYRTENGAVESYIVGSGEMFWGGTTTAQDLNNLLVIPLAGANWKEQGAFQKRVDEWVLTCFGQEIAKDVTERNHRFLEEALELVQTTGATQSECHQLVDYVFGRPVGETNQEIGGVMVTLVALCNAINHDAAEAGETELKRIWTKVEKIRAKQAAKPKHSPLPEHTHYWKEQQGGDYQRISELISQIFFYGDFKAETKAERDLEVLLRGVGLWPTNEEEIIQRKYAPESAPPNNQQGALGFINELREFLYDNAPCGQIDAFELIKVISAAIKKIDVFTESPLNQKK